VKITDSIVSSTFSAVSSESVIPSVKEDLEVAPEYSQHVPSLTELRNKKDYELTFSDKIIKQELDKIIKALEGAKTNLKFSVHEDADQIIVKVINSETEEVIREIPPEKIVDMIAKMMKQVGLLIDQKM
jgi:flagellar protein FlaG